MALAGTHEEVIEEIRRREEAHGLSLMVINFTSTQQIEDFGENVVAKLG